MSGYPNPGSGGGGSVGTLAQVLAKGADANGVEITDAHDPTAAQSLATAAYVIAHSGGGWPTSALQVYSHSSSCGTPGSR